MNGGVVGNVEMPDFISLNNLVTLNVTVQSGTKIMIHGEKTLRLQCTCGA